MRRALALTFVVAAGPAFADPPTARAPATATSEATRLGAEYFIQKAGASWTYQLQGGGRGRVAITAFVDWRASFTLSLGKKTASGTWRVKDGHWLERAGARADGEVVLLPAVMTRGTRWQAPASLEKGTRAPAQFEVIALDAQVELPNGSLDGCLAVLETGLDGSEPFTHYYAPNVGKVAVRGPADWLLRLVEFRAGGRARAE
ncbi:MAG: hypothetical protein INH41_08580 [Myxococcaceae bacterium]|jgi:hypothetical protein|nr:hypothetical protein [Myxococcaceae bacterium]